MATPQYYLHKTFHHHTDGLKRQGEVIEYDGNPGSYMEPRNKEAVARHKKYRDFRKVKKLQPLKYWFPFDGELHVKDEREDVAQPMIQSESTEPYDYMGEDETETETEVEPEVKETKPVKKAPARKKRKKPMAASFALIAETKEVFNLSDEDWDALPDNEKQARLTEVHEAKEE